MSSTANNSGKHLHESSHNETSILNVRLFAHQVNFLYHKWQMTFINITSKVKEEHLQGKKLKI